MRFSRFTGWMALSCALLGAATTVEPPKLRLGDNFRPRHYAVELTLEPGKDTFSGVVDIDIDVLQPRDVIWLNAVEIQIHNATIGGKAATTVPGNQQVIGLATGQTV